MGDPELRLEEFLKEVRADLDRTVRFWLTHSHDLQHGGFYTCLGEDGHVFDETKYTWLQSRQVWTYARLYNEVGRFRTAEILQAAENGAQFLLSYVKNPSTMKCYFSLTKEGLPIKTQRSLFAECFYVMALSELSRATNNQMYKDKALSMMKQLEHWARHDDSGLGGEKLAGQPSVSSLAVPMMLLCVVDQLVDMDPSLAPHYLTTQHWALNEVRKHVQRKGNAVLENVTPDAQELPGSLGRLQNPGHAIEAGWFLLKLAQKTEDYALQTLATESFIKTPFTQGWDPEFGGLFYFLDVDGEPPAQLEWDMKLWWPHNEAMIAMLMAYRATRDKLFLQNFATVFDYSYSHFVDRSHGEWFGYLNRRGEITHRLKGGAWKGCFHVPRCLMMCEKLLEQLISDKQKS